MRLSPIKVSWDAQRSDFDCVIAFFWLRGRDLNPRPSGYEPDELPGCSTPRLHYVPGDDEIKLKMILRDNQSANQELAPAVGFEPTTNRLTADRSTTELRWIIYL